MKQILLTLLSIFCLCMCILSSGIVLCAYVPGITETLSRTTCLVDQAKFNRDQLVDVANQTRAYVAGEIEKKDLYSTIEQINKDAKTEYANLQGNDFAAINDQYTLDSKCLKHLEDVQNLFANIRIAFCICGIGAIAFLILLFVFCGRSAFGRALMWSGLIILAIIIALSVWAVCDFNSMFNWLHSLFFSSNSWLFSPNSLLITIYPTPFWVCMGLICVGISAVASLIFIIVGKIVK